MLSKIFHWVNRHTTTIFKTTNKRGHKAYDPPLSTIFDHGHFIALMESMDPETGNEQQTPAL